MPKKAKAAKAMSDPPGIWHWEQRDQDRGRRRDHQDRDRSRRGLGGGGGGGNGNGGGGTGGGGKGGDGNGGDGNDRDGYSHYRSWSPVTAPPAGEGWSGGWSRDRGGRGWQQSQHNTCWCLAKSQRANSRPLGCGHVEMLMMLLSDLGQERKCDMVQNFRAQMTRPKNIHENPVQAPCKLKTDIFL